MSDLPELDLRSEIARMDRDRAETQKLLAGVGKLNAEALAMRATELRDGADSRKLLAEQAKLLAEQVKLQREWRLAPWLAWLGIGGGAVTVIGALLRWSGH
jgi:hypothetical protein